MIKIKLEKIKKNQLKRLTYLLKNKEILYVKSQQIHFKHLKTKQMKYLKKIK